MGTVRAADLSLSDTAYLGLTGGAVALVLAILVSRWLLSRPPQRLIARNYRGMEVPVVLGIAVSTAACITLVGLGLLAPSTWEAVAIRGAPAACLLVLVTLGAAGAWDDLRGDERPRGFGGHLGALRGGAITGGVVKLVTGGVAGLAAGWILEGSPIDVVATGLLVALTANLLNLLDRAPGRCAKTFFGLAVLLSVWAPRDWIASAAPAAGALVGVVAADLRERGMLGDAGANPLGGVLGVGLAMWLDDAGRWVAVVLLLMLNLSSERWSFGSFIDSNPWLRRLDRWGRAHRSR